MIECQGRQKIVGKTLAELNIRLRTGVLVLGLQDGAGDFQMNPDVNKPIRNEEKLFVIGTNDQIASFWQEFT
ncbi:MAG: TrkA C-terminal domain-containing protein [Bacteroidia bacterium]